MKNSFKLGMSFGITSGIITTLGLMTGLDAGTHLKSAVLGGIFTIAIADAFSDALGIHVSRESEKEHTSREIWSSTISTFLSKLLIALSFALPVMIFNLELAVLVSAMWGVFLLSVLSLYIAKEESIAPWKVITEHLAIAFLVIIFSYYIGGWVHSLSF